MQALSISAANFRPRGLVPGMSNILAASCEAPYLMRDVRCGTGAAMRTTLAIDDDILVALKAITHQEGRSLGEVMSDLARRALQRPAALSAERNGVPLLRVRNKVMVTLDLVNALRDESP